MPAEKLAEKSLGELVLGHAAPVAAAAARVVVVGPAAVVVALYRPRLVVYTARRTCGGSAHATPNPASKLAAPALALVREHAVGLGNHCA